LARHKFGCRVLQRLLEHCAPVQMVGIINALLLAGSRCCQHIYAHYVMQHICEFGSPEQQCEVGKVLVQTPQILAENTFAAGVAAKLFEHARSDYAVSLPLVLLADDHLVPSMASSRKGHAAVKAMLAILDGANLELACSKIQSELSSPKTRYGRRTLAIAGTAAAAGM